jgi:hypothetical protein
MMKSTTLLYARTSALPAIAAALALSSTPLLAQEVPQAQPTTTEPTTNTPPTSTSTPAPDEPTTSATDSSTDAPAATDAAATAPSTTTRSAHRTTHVTSAKAAPAPAPKVASHTVTSRTVHAAPLAAAAPVAPANRTSHVDPVVDLSAQPPAPASAAVKPAKKKDATLPIAGGALAFLAIGGVAVAMTRRRDEDEEIAEEKVEHEPVAAAPEPVIHEEQPSIVGPSAFAWGGAEQTRPAMSDEGDRRPGETWVERAYRGPTADNPSASLRTRLKRAAFFDKRERDVAAGVAEPVDMDAGLPDAMIEEQERELA